MNNNDLMISIENWIKKKLTDFLKKPERDLKSLKIKELIKRKNPYLFRAKNILIAEEMVEHLMQANSSSAEETAFGKFLEDLALHICEYVYDGKKSGIQGAVDLEFTREGVRYIVSIKSGPNWGNAGQIKKMREDFKSTIKIIRQNDPNKNIRAVNGCCYGTQYKDFGDYEKICGQKFWQLISDDPKLYEKIIIPIGKTVKKNKNNTIAEIRKDTKYRLIKEFREEFCTQEDEIDWKKIVRFNSKTQTKS